MAKYRIWYNTLFDKRKVAPNPWLVQEGQQPHVEAPGVTIQTEVSFVTGPPGSTPQGWAECEGQASRDGQSNFIVIRPL